MKLFDRIRTFISPNHVLRWNGGYYGVPITLTQHRFGETIFLNCCQMLTDIYAELIWITDFDTPKWQAWKAWADRNGQRILLELFLKRGYVVVGYHAQVDAEGNRVWYFYELPQSAWSTKTIEDRTEVYCYDQNQLFYVLKSPTFEQVGLSDHDLCKGYIAMIDAVLNGATTTAERLGAYVVMTPKDDNYGGVLDEADKKKLEKEVQEDYGMLKNQRQMMILPRPMDSQVVSLANADTRMKEKATLAILAIADRIKVPANQIAIIDAGSSKALSNGTELREGDMSKYRAFRRLIDATLWDMAKEIGLRPNYMLENEPKSVQGQTIETPE